MRQLHPANAGCSPATLGLQHQMLLPAVRVAELLRSGRGARYASGGYEAPGFLWRSSSVFQSFSTLLLQRYCRSRPGLALSKEFMVMATPTSRAGLPTGFVEGARDLTSEPDARIRRSGRDVLVLDA